jgi:hypothetical protein
VGFTIDMSGVKQLEFSSDHYLRGTTMGFSRLFTPGLTKVEYRGFSEPRKKCDVNGGQRWNNGAAQATDTGIFNPLLYQRH